MCADAGAHSKRSDNSWRTQTEKVQQVMDRASHQRTSKTALNKEHFTKLQRLSVLLSDWQPPNIDKHIFSSWVKPGYTVYCRTEQAINELLTLQVSAKISPRWAVMREPGNIFIILGVSGTLFTQSCQPEPFSHSTCSCRLTPVQHFSYVWDKHNWMAENRFCPESSQMVLSHSDLSDSR